LLKPLYGLKQAGHKWNNKLDDKLKVHDYQCLFSDLCAYIQRVDGNLGILMVWVDDSLLFASSDKMMDHMKDTLHSGWEVTDLGEPSKIVGIEVTCSNDAIMISQEKYIENILQKEGMANANVGTIVPLHIQARSIPELSYFYPLPY
jgi:Reverse transcriptase (RNA-dependent DNA polymerase)